MVPFQMPWICAVVKPVVVTVFPHAVLALLNSVNTKGATPSFAYATKFRPVTSFGVDSARDERAKLIADTFCWFTEVKLVPIPVTAWFRPSSNSAMPFDDPMGGSSTALSLIGLSRYE